MLLCLCVLLGYILYIYMFVNWMQFIVCVVVEFCTLLIKAVLILNEIHSVLGHSSYIDIINRYGYKIDGATLPQCHVCMLFNVWNEKWGRIIFLCVCKKCNFYSTVSSSYFIYVVFSTYTDMYVTFAMLYQYRVLVF